MDTRFLYQLPLPFDNLDEAELLKTSSDIQAEDAGYDTECIEIQPQFIDGESRRRYIEFSCWIDESIVKRGLSRRWFTHTIEREEVYIDAEGKRRRRVLVRAKAYSGWRIIQQLHKYADKAELVDPPELREQMRQEVGRMYRFYEK